MQRKDDVRKNSDENLDLMYESREKGVLFLEVEVPLHFRPLFVDENFTTSPSPPPLPVQR